MTVRGRGGGEWLAAFFLFLIFVVIFRGLSLQSYGDDAFYVSVLDDDTVFGFISHRYSVWSGRALLDAINIVTIRHSIVWKIGIPLTFLLLCYQIYRLTLWRIFTPSVGVLIVAGVMFSISGDVTAWGSWWVTGFYNYLLPLTLGFFTLRCVLHKSVHSGASKALAIICAIIACQQEQVALSLLAALVVVAIYRVVSRASIRLDVMTLFAGVVSAGFLFLAPGNSSRLKEEMSWLPEFPRMGLSDKLLLGIDRINAHANDMSSHVFLLAMLVTFCLVFLLKRGWQLKPLVLVILGVGIVSFMLGGANLPDVSSKLLFSGKVLPENWTNYSVFVSYAKTMMIYGALACCVLYFSDTHADVYAGIGVLALSFGMIMAVAFSPTVYASGARVLYVPDVFMVAYVCWVSGKLFRMPILSHLSKRGEASGEVL